MSLTNLQIKNAVPSDRPVKLSDSHSSYLLVTPGGGKLWRFDYTFANKRKTLALGSYPKMSLLEARKARDQAKEDLANGIDPMQKKKAAKMQVIDASENTFEKVARRWFGVQSPTWQPSHSSRVISQLEQRAFPYIGAMPISKITSMEVLNVLRKMEDEGLGEATYKLRQRIESIFTFAIVEGKVESNPALNLQKALKPKPKEQNNPHLKEAEFGVFLQHLELYPGDPVTRLALKFMVLTFVRTTELRFAEWQEVDFEKAEWHIPASRMKMVRPHAVPLSRQALEVLDEVRTITGNSRYIFASPSSPMRPISSHTLIQAIYRMGYRHQLTVHGFRGTASTILNEHGFHYDVIEKQLSHVPEDSIRHAYNHAEYWDDRRTMMQWYSDKADELRQGFI